MEDAYNGRPPDFFGYPVLIFFLNIGFLRCVRLLDAKFKIPRMSFPFRRNSLDSSAGHAYATFRNQIGLSVWYNERPTWRMLRFELRLLHGEGHF